MPVLSGVIFALCTVPHGPLNSIPPANSLSRSGCPLTIGVWHSAQLAMVTRYSPRFSGVDRSGGGTGAVMGRGTPRIRYFTGDAMSVGGKGFRTGGNDRINTTT